MPVQFSKNWLRPSRLVYQTVDASEAQTGKPKDRLTETHEEKKDPKDLKGKHEKGVDFTHADTRAQLEQGRSALAPGRLTFIANRLPQIEKEKDDAKKRAGEALAASKNWPSEKKEKSATDSLLGSLGLVSQKDVKEGVDEKIADPQTQELLKECGLDKDPNLAILKDVFNTLIWEKIQSVGATETQKYGDELKTTFEELLKKMREIQKEKKIPSLKETLIDAAKFCGLAFINEQGFLQKNELKTFLTADLPGLVDAYSSYTKLDGEAKALGIARINLERVVAEQENGTGKGGKSVTIDIKKQLADGTLQLNARRIVFPEDSTKIDEIIERELTAALPEGLDANAKADIMGQIRPEIKKQAAPGATLELQANGEVKKIDEKVEAAAKAETEKAENEAKKQAEEAKAKSDQIESSSGDGLNGIFDKIVAAIGPFLEKLVEWLKNFMEGINGNMEDVGKGFSAKVTDWEKYPEPQQKQIRNFYEAAKAIPSKIPPKHLNTLLKDPAAVKKVLSAKEKADPISWDTYTKRVPDGALKSDETLTAIQVADRIIGSPAQKPSADTPVSNPSVSGRFSSNSPQSNNPGQSKQKSDQAEG